ncbi:unnamed protein product [Heligmosomoides polygyrus]|uniref:Nuclear receptor domain-containing protein n=1 Tax=Heligmosomoides polygyrus TaxID=6339 RepID=A0A183FS54_HELPZ|nr:unnamed protein product [Heligmosomoides polygyrus]
MTCRTDRYSRGTAEVRRKYCSSVRSSRRRQPLAGHALQPNNCKRCAAKVRESLQSEAVIGVGRKSVKESFESDVLIGVGRKLSEIGELVD